MKITIVIPAYNEERRIGDFLKSLKSAAYNLIFVDDGSTDKTPEILADYKKTNPKAEVLYHKVNLGKGAAMKTGAEAAFAKGADAVVFMDSDGQHSLDDLPNFIEALNKGNQFVIGTRNLSLGAPLVRYMGNKLSSMLVAFLFEIYVSDLLCGYRAITREAYEKTKWETPGYAVETEMIVRLGKHKIKHCEVPVKTIYLDSVKGVTILDAFGIVYNVFAWKIKGI